jgi:hypothetical protein
MQPRGGESGAVSSGMSDKIPNPLYTDEAKISRERLQPEGRDSSLEMKLCLKPKLHSRVKGE